MSRPTHAARLAEAVGGGVAPPAFVAELEAWVAGSARVRAFVDAEQAKVRHKLRSVPGDPEGLRDVRAELLVATRLLADKRFALGFETYASSGAGPDFTATFRGVTTFTVEVTRRRGEVDGAGVVEAAMAKLRQLPPSVANVVVVAGEVRADEASIEAALRVLRARVDGRDAAVLWRLRVASPRAFYERFRRLSAVVAWSDAGAGVATPWANPSARFPLDARALAAVVGALAADEPAT